MRAPSEAWLEASGGVSAHSSRTGPMCARSACWRLCGAASLLFLLEEAGEDQQVVGEYGGAHEGLESFESAAQAALHAAASEEHGDAALAASAESLSLLEDLAPLVRSALRCLLASALRDTFVDHAGFVAGGEVVVAVEASIGGQQLDRKSVV